MRRGLAIAALAAAFVAPAGAVEVTIVPNVSIGKVKLGMTLRQVEKALGQPQTINKRAELSGHRGYVEYGWNFSTFWVGFVRTKGVLHAALIGTDIVGETTRQGIGVGTPLATLRARFHVTCNVGPDGEVETGQYYKDRTMLVWNYCVLGPLKSPTTMFVMNCVQRWPATCGGFKVTEVIVREGILREE